jgi:hypothetical protein
VRPDRSYRYIYDLSESELANFAYYFEHDYIDGRDPEKYVQGLRGAVRRWYEHSTNGGLVYVDHGEDLAIWDLRPNPKRTVTILGGHERAVYHYCDQHRSLQHIEALPEVKQAGVAILPFLERLIEHRLMVCIDKLYLSLAVAKSAAPVENAPRERVAGQRPSVPSAEEATSA